MGLIRRWREATQQIREEEEAERKRLQGSYEEHFKRLYPHMARYYGMMHDEVIYDVCRRLDEVEKWLELNTTKR